MAEAFGVEGHVGDLASVQALTRVNAEQVSKDLMRKPTSRLLGEGCDVVGEASDVRTRPFRRDIGDGMHTKGMPMQHGKPDRVIEHEDQPAAREGQAGRDGWRRGREYH